jgi:hypothetical protein
MTKARTIGLAAGLLIGLFGLGIGFLVGGSASSRPPVLIGSGYVGSDQATFQVGDEFYGFQGSVAWTDRAGAFHPDGWPDCLPRLQGFTNIRFAATTEWFGDVGASSVSWVDCQG